MRILVLDDDPFRHDAFRRRLEYHEVTFTWSAEQALSALSEGPYDVAQLDHDLGPGLTGEDFVKEMLSKFPPEAWPRSVVVHSNNWAGAGRMTERLRDAGIPSRYEPFTA